MHVSITTLLYSAFSINYWHFPRAFPRFFPFSQFSLKLLMAHLLLNIRLPFHLLSFFHFLLFSFPFPLCFFYSFFFPLPFFLFSSIKCQCQCFSSSPTRRFVTFPFRYSLPPPNSEAGQLRLSQIYVAIFLY